ncbi:unnamed protein product [Allacma fusca]|uniref:Uncharacterized protein n=1 Tax=Allacma fusca TaxID=39272 RepID=A0A8J2PF70_9HEXA|nr:unnamed protein product [Allacma fusca]
MDLLKMTKDYLMDKQRSSFRGLADRSHEENIQGKIVLVTGASSGLGKVVSLQLAKRGATVIMACRNFIKGSRAMVEIKSKTNNGELVLMDLDLADFDSVRKFAYTVIERFPHINILINNAGILNGNGVLRNTKDHFEMHMAVNCLGHFLLTNLLLDHLKMGAPSRVVFLTSSIHVLANLNLEDLNLERASSLGFGNFVPYSNSKLAIALIARELGRRLEGSGVHTYSVCPGMIRTELFRNETWYKQTIYRFNLFFAGMTVNEGVEGILFCALSKKCAAESGKLYRFCKLWETANKNLKDELAIKMWSAYGTKLVKTHNQKQKLIQARSIQMPDMKIRFQNQVRPYQSKSENNQFYACITESEWELYKAKSRIFNPCECCVCTFCNLRGSGILGMVTHSIFIPADCEMAPNDYIQDACKNHSAPTLHSMRTYRGLYISFYLLFTLFCWIVGILLLAATFGRNALAAIIAAICINVSSLLYFMQCVCLIIFFHNWPQMPLSFLQWKDDLLRTPAIALQIIFSLLIVFTVVIHLYFSFCSFQLSRQIKAEVDVLKNYPTNAKAQKVIVIENSSVQNTMA